MIETGAGGGYGGGYGGGHGSGGPTINLNLTVQEFGKLDRRQAEELARQLVHDIRSEMMRIGFRNGGSDIVRGLFGGGVGGPL